MYVRIPLHRDVRICTYKIQFSSSLLYIHTYLPLIALLHPHAVRSRRGIGLESLKHGARKSKTATYIISTSHVYLSNHDELVEPQRWSAGWESWDRAWDGLRVCFAMG